MNKGLKIAIGALVIGFALHNIGNLETKEETRYNAFIDHPYAGMNAEDINNTKLGKPHEILTYHNTSNLKDMNNMMLSGILKMTKIIIGILAQLKL